MCTLHLAENSHVEFAPEATFGSRIRTRGTARLAVLLAQEVTTSLHRSLLRYASDVLFYADEVQHHTGLLKHCGMS